MLYQGDGVRRGVEVVNAVMSTVAGSGQLPGLSCGPFHAGPAREVCLTPQGVAVAADGTTYVVDTHQQRVFAVTPGGSISVFAGTGSFGCTGDGIPATTADLCNPIAVRVGPDGSVYILESGQSEAPPVQSPRIRRVAPNGMITTVAGTGSLSVPSAIAVAPDGTIYIAQSPGLSRLGTDGVITIIAPGLSGSAVAVGIHGEVYLAETLNRRVRQVASDGVITTVAGDGSFCNPPTQPCGDGGPATQASLIQPQGLAVAPDGSLYIADLGRVRRVDSDGTISTLAGTGSGCNDSTAACGDGGPALQAALVSIDVAVAPDGGIDIADSGDRRIRRVTPPLPGFTGSDIGVPSRDGTELYQFDARGRHLRTINTLTAATLYSFAYDSAGRLSAVTDGDGNVTTIQRDGAGNATGILSPFGQVTRLTLDANGYLASVKNPANETYQFSYSADGLLTNSTTPRGFTTSFTYDPLGLLTREDDPAGGFRTLARTDQTDSRTIVFNTALNRPETFQTQNLPTADVKRIATDPAGLQAQVIEGANGTDTTTAPDGMTGRATRSADPRWGMQTPLTASRSTRTPGGLNLTSAFARGVTLPNPSDPLTLTAQNDTATINGRAYTNHYDAATRTFTLTTPVGRQQTTGIDTQGRITQRQFADLNPANFTYDARGRLFTAVSGPGAAVRSFSYAYNTDGSLSSITDPLSRSTTFAYDAAGRITQKTLTDGRIVGFAYDANGNLTSITPPGRPAHGFAYSPVDLRSSYTAPNVGVGNQTTYAYNLDRQLTTITRPDRQTLNFAYDSGARLSTLTIPSGVYTVAYNATTGQMAGMTAPGGSTLSYAYDGALLTRTTWAGAIAGNVSRTFDDNFRVTSQSINGGNTLNFAYDDDSLLTGAGTLSLTRSAQSGLITGTTLGNVTDTRSYSGFAELTNYSSFHNAASIYSVAYTYDKLSRITQKIETIDGATATFDYTYDLAGRLTTVTKNSATIAAYAYDSNSNRLSFTGPGGTVNGSYDSQDRLTGYGTATYAYTANGELVSKTVGGQVTIYQYDVIGNLEAVTLPNATQIDYLVDGQDRRIGKRVNGTLVQGFLYQNQINPVAEVDGSNNVVSRFVYGSRGNAPDYMIKAGVTYRIISDHLGSPRLVVDVTTGNVAQRIDYDEFGNVLADTSPGFQPFGFAGGLYDGDTALIRFGARDYDPATGRWTAKDPIRFAGGQTNLYGYVVNDPINLVDVSGLGWDELERVFIDMIEGSQKGRPQPVEEVPAYRPTYGGPYYPSRSLRPVRPSDMPLYPYMKRLWDETCDDAIKTSERSKGELTWSDSPTPPPTRHEPMVMWSYNPWAGLGPVEDDVPGMPAGYVRETTTIP